MITNPHRWASPPFGGARAGGKRRKPAAAWRALSAAALSAVALRMGSVELAAADAIPMDAHYQAARAALLKGDPISAKRELRLDLQDNPLHAESHFLLASLLGREGDIDQAAVGYQQTVKLEPNNAAARYNLGTALLLRGESVLAARQLEDAITMRPDYVPSYINLAKAYYLTGLPELAVVGYREALRRDPSNAIALRNLAFLTATAGGQAGSAADAAPALAGASGPANALVGQAQPPVLAEPPAQSALDDAEVRALHELVRDLPHVTVERRGDHLTLGGWTSSTNEQKLLNRILARQTNVLDLTTEDIGDPHRLLEVDATMFHVIGIDTQSAGRDFLRQVALNASIVDGATAGFSWLYSAAISYQVNIANASRERIAFLARPHLTTLSGTPATFIAGGDTVYKVTGNVGGDIKTYPFGTTLDVTPTLLRTQAADGTPRVHIVAKAGRKSVLSLDSPEAQGTGNSVYANISVTSEAVLDLNQTLILTGLSQRQSTESRSGVPGLKSIPIIKYLFSENKTIISDLAIIILLTPRDPAYWDEQNQKATEEFVEKRRAYLQAARGTAEDMQRFKERYPDWNKLAPNRFAAHFFLMENSPIYRAANGVDLANENLDFDLLGKPPKTKAKGSNP